MELIGPISTLTGSILKPRETVHWYLPLDRLESQLHKWLESKRATWRHTVVNFAISQIREGLPERAITRDLSWGVPIPLDDRDAAGKVLYVWFNALSAMSLSQQDSANTSENHGLPTKSGGRTALAGSCTSSVKTTSSFMRLHFQR